MPGSKVQAPRGSRVTVRNKNEPALSVFCVACAGAGDGDTQAGPGGGEEEEGGAGETTAGGDEPQAEAGGAGGETQGEAEIAGILIVFTAVSASSLRSFVACECFDSSFALPQSRMLSRYLPVRKDDFDLHGYIEAAGHNPDACFHLAITDKTCRGFLVKMGGKIKTWKKRWFVFDQNRRTLTYYAGGSRPLPVLSALPTTG